MARKWTFVDGSQERAIWSILSYCELASDPFPFIAVYAHDVYRALELGRQISERVPRGYHGYVILYACNPRKQHVPAAMLRSISMYAVRLITSENRPLTYDEFLEWHARHMKQDAEIRMADKHA